MVVAICLVITSFMFLLLTLMGVVEQDRRKAILSSVGCVVCFVALILKVITL